MIYLKLFYEFFKIGLFTFGGGLATIPFLQDLSQKTGWFTLSQLTDFIAISESTPGPVAVNMATYTGYEVAGVLGGFIATLGLIFPAFILISLMAKFLSVFRGNKYVEWAFYGLRPCVLALIASALLGLVQITLLNTGACFANLGAAFNWKACIIFAVVYLLLNVKKLKNVHPAFFLLFSAILGVVLYR